MTVGLVFMDSRFLFHMVEKKLYIRTGKKLYIVMFVEFEDGYSKQSTL